MPSLKILILTIHHGAAHRRVAAALQRALLDLQPGLTVDSVNALDYCARWFRLYYDSYLIPLKYWPALWGWIEGIEHRHSSTGPSWLYWRGGQPLFRFLEDFKPDIVVATETGVGELAAMHKRRSQAAYCLVGVDGLDVDRAWAQPEIELYPIMPGEVAAQLEAAGVPPAKILPCGLPVDPAFGSLTDREAVRAKLGMEPDSPVLIVLFGGAGHGRPRRILAELNKVRQPFQTVFIAGRSRRFEEDLERRCAGRPGTRVLGWVDNMHEWLAAADLVLNKPSGVALIEAMNSGVPFLAFDPLPGNERRHCELIEKWKVGYWIRRPGEIAPTIERLLTFPEELQSLRERAKALARPNAAREAAEGILRLGKGI